MLKRFASAFFIYIVLVSRGWCVSDTYYPKQVNVSKLSFNEGIAKIDKIILMRYLSVVILLFLPFYMSAQQKDFHVWTGASATYEMDKLEFGFEAESRFVNNATWCEKVFVSPSVGYDLFKQFNVDAGVRYSFVNDYEYAFRENSTRVWAGGTYSLKLDQIRLSYRLRYQHTISEWYKYPEHKYSDVLRNKIGGKYVFQGSPYRIGAGAEVFTPLKVNTDLFSKYRLSGFLEYFITSKLKSKVSLLVQKELFVANPEEDYILAIGLNYKIN